MCFSLGLCCVRGRVDLLYTNRLKVPIFIIIMANRILINGSGSSGNNIIIESNGKKLLVDLGISAREILKSVNYKIDDWSAAICSHR